MKLFSVVIPLFNKEAFIGRALDSVLKQTVHDLEIIVVDDGSTDGSADLVACVKDQRIRLIRQENAGVSAARNTGIAAASRAWIAFLDADDEWSPDHLQALIALVSHFPDAVAVGTAYHKIDAIGQIEPLRHPYGGSPGYFKVEDYFALSAQYDHPLHSSSAAARKAVLDRIGGFPVGVKAGEDLITWARLALAGEVAFCNQPSAIFYVPDQRMENRQANIRRPAQPDRVGESLEQLYQQHTLPGLRKYIGLWHEIRAMLFLELNERRYAYEELKLSMRYAGFKRKYAMMLMAMLMPSAMRAMLFEKLRNLKKKASHD